MTRISKSPATSTVNLTRREVIAALAVTGATTAFGVTGLAANQPAHAANAESLAAHAHDWDWLVGTWDVWHRRLRERLVGSKEWDEFGGKSIEWNTMGGFGTVDDDILELPSGLYRAFGIRAFDPATRHWSIWWLDGRNPTSIDPPVVGRFQGDTGTFFGRHVHKGQAVTARFRWHEIHGSRPHWDQAFSTDGGEAWEINWRNYFTRKSATPQPLPLLTRAEFPEQQDWEFLVGSWKVHNRRLKQRLAGSNQWEEFDSTLVNWPVMGGRGNVGDNVFNAPSGSYRGMSVRTFDPQSRQWLSWWLDARSPTSFAAPVRGSFVKGVGTLTGDDVFNGRPIKVRSQWLQTTGTSPRWEQASSADGGTTWETNWVSEFTRTT